MGRRVIDNSIKFRALRDYFEGVYPRRIIAEEAGVTLRTLSNWVNQFKVTKRRTK